VKRHLRFFAAVVRISIAPDTPGDNGTAKDNGPPKGNGGREQKLLESRRPILFGLRRVEPLEPDETQ
jgi:hypothetical protein